MSVLKYWVWLASRQGVTALDTRRLLDAFGSPEQIYRAGRPELAGCALSPYCLEKLCDKSMDRVEAILEACAAQGIQLITLQDSQYPARLTQIYDPPVVLYVKGRMPEIDDVPVIAMVGTRKCTAYALDVTEKLAGQVARGGGLVLSGLANGVDQAAHRGALRAGGKTVAVMGCGLDIDYPKNAAEMKRDIAATGALISEYPPGCPALAQNFPPRNRILSGLSVGVVIVEAPEKSGAMITARLATEQDRDVFVHPGTVEDPVNAGNYALMRDGAKPVRTGADILEEYVHLFPQAVELERARPQKPLFSRKSADGDESGRILAALEGDQALHVDEIIERTRLPAATVLANLTVMEITGSVRQLAGKRFQREPGW